MKPFAAGSHEPPSIDESTLLGVFLKKSGAISSGNLDRALIAQRENPDSRLGDILLNEGLISQEGLNAHLHQQELLRSIYKSAANSWIKKSTSIGKILISKKIVDKKQIDDAINHQSDSQEKLGEILVRKGLATAQQISDALHHQSSLRKKLFATLAALIITTAGFSPIAEAGASGSMSISLTILPTPIEISVERFENPEGEFFKLDGVTFLRDASGEYIPSYEDVPEHRTVDYSITTELSDSENNTRGTLNFYINGE